MRHGKSFNHLGRKKGHRDAMLKNMAASLIIHKRIFTTTAKAKALKVYVEPLITKSKDNTTHNRRVVFGYLQNNDAVTELFTEVAQKVADRPGGYTRILKTHNRLGDNADMCMMELVDFNDLMLEAKAASDKSAGKKKTRRRGGKSKTAATKTAPVVEEVEVEVDPETSEEAPVAEVEAEVEVEAEAKEEVVEEAEAEVEAKEDVVEEAEVEATEAPAADDLTKIEGVGPKIASVLAEAGLATYAAVSESTPDAIRAILDGAEGNFKAHDPSTWVDQAKMAAEGKWDELKKWQDELDGGKPTE